MLFLLFAGLVAATTACWAPPFQPNCTQYNVSATDPGITGNLAAPVFYNALLTSMGSQVVEAVRPDLGMAWQRTIPFVDYHVSLSYLYCTRQVDTDKAHAALKTFRWDSFVVEFDHATCEDGFVEIGVSSTTQAVLTNFTRSLLAHLQTEGGVYIPALELLQPPYHVTVGEYNSLLAPNWTLPAGGSPWGMSQRVQLRIDTIYLGMRLYKAQDYGEEPGGLAWFIIAIIVLLVVLAIVYFGYSVWARRIGRCP